MTNNSNIFTEDHKFLDGERVFYQPRDQKVISGLTTESAYFVQVTGQKSLTLHQTPSDAVAGINTMTLDGFGEGTQYLVASELKQVVSSVVVLDPGKNYENKRRTIPSVGVNTASNRVEIKNKCYIFANLHHYHYNPQDQSEQDLVFIPQKIPRKIYHQFKNKLKQPKFTHSMIAGIEGNLKRTDIKRETRSRLLIKLEKIEKQIDYNTKILRQAVLETNPRVLYNLKNWSNKNIKRARKRVKDNNFIWAMGIEKCIPTARSWQRETLNEDNTKLIIEEIKNRRASK